jgi:hypothetical protein
MMTVENKLFPGRPNYTGPTSGFFGLLHHEELFEESHDVNERIEYVKKHKPENEVSIRLHNMIYIDPDVCSAPTMIAPIDAEYSAECAPIRADYDAKVAPFRADYDAKVAPIRDFEDKRGALDAYYRAKCAPFHAEYEAKVAPFRAEYKVKRSKIDAEITAYIKSNIPDCPWNGTTLVF